MRGKKFLGELRENRRGDRERIRQKARSDKREFVPCHLHSEGLFAKGTLPMPTYEYECAKCGKTFEVFQSMKDDPLKTCPNKKCKGSG